MGYDRSVERQAYREAARHLPTTGVVTQVSHRANVTIYKNGAYVTAQVWVPKTMVEENDFVLARAGLPGGQVSYDTRDRAR